MPHPVAPTIRPVLGPALIVTALAITLTVARQAGADMAALMLAAGAIFLWATGLIAESLTALIFLTFAMLAHVAPMEVVFSGYGSSAFWLIFSGLVVGAAIKVSGLGDRIAAGMARLVGKSWRGALTGAAMFGFGMAFVMPSAMGRIALIIPILAALADHLGLPKGAKGHSALILAGVFGTYLPSSAILPANVPNNVLSGITEVTLGYRLTFADYFITHFPVLGLAKALLLVLVLLVRYGGEAGGMRHAVPAGTNRPPMAAGERRMALILCLALAFWATDWLHGISPAWVGMAAAICCLLPGFGLLPPKALQSLNFEPLIYVGAIIGLGALVARSGLGGDLAGRAIALLTLEADHATLNFAELSLLSAVIGLLTTLPGVPAVMTPLTDGLAQASGLAIPAVLAAQVVGFSVVFLPYQAPPLLMAAQTAELPRGEMAWLCLATAIPSIVLLLPLDILWLLVAGLL